jgi:hypothetical protein
VILQVHDPERVGVERLDAVIQPLDEVDVRPVVHELALDAGADLVRGRVVGVARRSAAVRGQLVAEQPEKRVGEQVVQGRVSRDVGAAANHSVGIR